MNNTNRCYSSYLHSILNPLLFKKVIDTIVKILKPLEKSYDGIAFRGMSGALIAPIVASKVKKKLIMVRKEGDGSHSGLKSEGWKMVDRIVIIDDMISSGETIHTILANLIEARKMVDENSCIPEVVAIILYNDYNYYTDGLHKEIKQKPITGEHLSKALIYSFKYDILPSNPLKAICSFNELTRKRLRINFENESNYYVDLK